jgi:copper(I)-binding protein
MAASPSDETVSMRHRLALFLTVAATLYVGFAHAVTTVNEPWIGLGKNGSEAELYMRLTSTEGATLVGVNSFAARKTEMREAGSGKRALLELALPPGKEMLFAPQGLRVQLHGLTRPLAMGQHVPVTLVMRSNEGTRQEILINAEVRKHSPRDDEGEGHDHDHAHHAH